jgi:hypothetical protein
VSGIVGNCGKQTKTTEQEIEEARKRLGIKITKEQEQEDQDYRDVYSSLNK